jgi:type IV pilus assembly protein PilF
MQTKNKRIYGCALLTGACLILSGCITETNSDLMKKKDKERYIQNSVTASLEYLQLGDTKNAFRHANNAMEADAKSAEAHNAMALLYRNMQDEKNEEKHFKLAIRYNPNLSKVRNNYAVFLFQRERYTDALFQLEKASKDPSYENRGLAFENMGRAYLGLKDIAQAEVAFKEALRIDERMVRSYLELAQINFIRGDLKQANQYIQQYGTLGRHSARSLWLGIQIERKLGNKDALASYELALRNIFADSAEYKAYKASIDQPIETAPIQTEPTKSQIELMDVSAPKLITQ